MITITTGTNTPSPSGLPPEINLAPRGGVALADKRGAYHWVSDRKSIVPMAVALEGSDVQAMQQFIRQGLGMMTPSWNTMYTGRYSMYRDDREDTTIYKVVVNHEEQYSIWPADRENALGWHDVGKTGTKAECLAYIKEVWTDMRPLSLRKLMEETERQKASDQATT